VAWWLGAGAGQGIAVPARHANSGTERVRRIPVAARQVFEQIALPLEAHGEPRPQRLQALLPVQPMALAPLGTAQDAVDLARYRLDVQLQAKTAGLTP